MFKRVAKGQQIEITELHTKTQSSPCLSFSGIRAINFTPGLQESQSVFVMIRLTDACTHTQDKNKNTDYLWLSLSLSGS